MKKYIVFILPFAILTMAFVNTSTPRSQWNQNIVSDTMPNSCTCLPAEKDRGDN